MTPSLHFWRRVGQVMMFWPAGSCWGVAKRRTVGFLPPRRPDGPDFAQEWPQASFSVGLAIEARFTKVFRQADRRGAGSSGPRLAHGGQRMAISTINFTSKL
jgi:hypothetical protein